MGIVWRPAMSIGDKAVDRDHRYLIDLINSFERSLTSFENSTNTMVALKQLEDYASGHFAREEALQLAIGYPDFEAHKAKHRSLVVQLKEMMARFESTLEKQGESGLDQAMFIAFIRFWLIDHVIKEDLRLKPFFRQSRSLS